MTVAKRMLKQAFEIMPFLETYEAQIFPNPALPHEFAQMYPFQSIDMIPDNLLIYEGDGIGTSSGIKGLSVVSYESYPGLGSFGPTLAAVQTIASATQKFGIPGF